MSLFGALNIGQTSLATQQIALQITGNNIANANTPGYSRQTANITSNGSTQIAPGQYVGTGVNVSSIDRQVNEAVDSSLRDATSSLEDSNLQDSFLGRIESSFGALNDNDLSSRLGDFFNNFSALANNPQDAGQRTVVIQGGASLAGYVQNLRTQLVNIRNDADTQVQQLATQANSLVQSIANLNQQIIKTQSASGGAANELLDQRSTALTNLSKLMNITTVDQGNGEVNVYAGSMSLVQGTDATALTTQPGTDPTGKLKTTSLVTAARGAPVPITGGQLGALISVRDTHIGNALSTLNTLASSLINTVNSIHSQGQGVTGFSTLTGATAVSDPTLALNAPTATTGLPSVPVNGTFNINVKDLTTGQITTKQIKVDFTAPTPTTLNALATALSGAGVSASVDPSGHLNIQSTSTNNTFSFSDDTSGVLAALGVNTFFAGSDASNITVNQTLANNPDYLAAGRDNIAGSNANAQALALGYSATSSQLGGLSLQDYYTNYIGQLATTAKAAHDDAQSQSIIHDTIFSQQQAISGVSMDEEAINLTKYQRAFEGSARYISVVDQMMQTVLAMIT